VYLLLLLAGGAGAVASAANPMPDSEISYPGASATSAFVAQPPYQVNAKGTLTTVDLYGVPRKNDYSGNVPFVNPETNYPDPATIQAWSSSTGTSVNIGSNMTNAGLYGRVDKQTFGTTPVTMVRYNKGDGITEGKCRSQLNSFKNPSRTHNRWELEVAFGQADGVNDWTLTPTGQSPVLVWQMSSMTQSNPPLAIVVDTDSQDTTKLMLSLMQRVGTQTYPQAIARVNGIPRNTMVPIVIDAFMDERDTANGGKGVVQFWVNNVMILDKIGPTRDVGAGQNYWSLDTYLFTEANPYPYTRATFWKTARMLVFPPGVNTPVGTTSTADTTAPSVPTNFAATASDSTKVNLSWSASIDNMGVTGYIIFKDGKELMRNNETGFTDTTVVAGATYNYKVQAFDAAGNFSAGSTTTVTVPVPVPAVSISSYSVENITTNSALINWVTNIPTTGDVSYGTSATNLSSKVTVSTSATSQSARISGLSPRTVYYYKISVNNGSTFASSSFTTAAASIALPDVIVTGVSYANGIFTSTVKNQGAAATPAGVVIGVAYFVDDAWKTWGSVTGPLAAGASVTIGTKGGAYSIPKGSHKVMAYVDDINRFAESNETNNQLSKSVTVK
jgi:hypothetical protein